MESPLPNFDELLSGMLDGILSDEEMRQLDKAMADDSSLQKRLDEISWLRIALLSGRTRSTLGPEFAKKVSMQSRSRARQMGLQCPEWFRSNDHDDTTTNTSNSKPYANVNWRPWMYGGVLATAAVFAIVFTWVPAPERQGLISQIPAEIPIDDDKSRQVVIEPNNFEKKNDASPILAAEPIAPSREQPDGSSKSETIAAAPPIETFAESKPIQPEIPLASQSTKQPGKSPFPADQRLNDILNYAKSKLDADLKTDNLLTLVLDITIDKAAMESHVLESIFERHGIAYAEDLSINSEQLAALEASQLTGKANTSQSDRMGVVFIRAVANRLSLAMRDISDRYNDFPKFSVDIANDNSVDLLVKQLSGIKVAAGKEGVARPLLPPLSLRSSLPFTSSTRKDGMLSREMMKKGTGVPLPESHEFSNVLLLIRAAN